MLFRSRVLFRSGVVSCTSGDLFPQLKDHYVYGDWGSGFVWGLKVNEKGEKTANVVLKERNPAKGTFKPTAFVERSDGELWILSWDGRIYEMTK